MNKETKALKKYFARDLNWGWVRQYQAQCVFNFLITASRFCEKGIVLDAGAGHQRYKPFFAKSLYISQEHADGIKFKGMHNIQYDLINPIDSQIPLKSNCLDGVLSTSVVEHLRYPDRFCKEAYRVLKPGGKLFINVPFVLYEHEIPYDYNRPTKYTLQKWLEEAGFKEFIIKPSSSCIEAVCNMLPPAIYIDLLKSDQKYDKVLFQIIKSPKNIFTKTFLLARFSLVVLFYLMAVGISWFLKLLIDKGPYDNASLPIGWVVIATKQGKRQVSQKLISKESFLEKFRI